ncbi:hypothetical protein [Streptomyces chartreusis]|uniref:hypothetical protein n=1 Tax=Streptomyces chartreusis TaxID=1969 RepID=UPI00123DA33C|nr:hypothetical protein [Streptomyces chartreusis]QEV66269.1 hypothetical protein CP983_06035 [Streptomyces chartreusis]GGW99124.1 hypothetical protein GCM10010321_12000 [Streptomyces chartreusis]
MSNEIATRDNQQVVAVQQPANQPVESSLQKWAQEASAISGIANAIAGTSLAGAYRNDRDAIVAVILAGHEVGLKPMTSLKSIDVIQGQPALRAHAMRAIVLKAGHEIELVESDARHCVMRGRRKGAEAWQTVEWDMGRAAQMKLTEKSEWKKQPKTMLIARATGEICRLVAADALHGMPYVAEELGGYVHGEIVQQKQAPLSVAALTAPVTEAPAEPAPTDVVDVDTDDDHAAAVRELRDFGEDQGITDDIDVLAYEALGAPLEHVSANAIRELVAKLRNAAQNGGAA